VTDVLIVGETERCPELRHELPLHVGDPFVYAEVAGRRVVVVWSIEGDRIAAVDPSVEIVPAETISVDDLPDVLERRFYENLGYATGLSKPEGTVLREGFNHALGHGVGLAVHEAPALSKKGHELLPGDVITLEPGLYRHGLGGVRLEDLVLVTDDGAEAITDFPYDLDPARSVVETAQ
jgi:hypothetical protein